LNFTKNLIKLGVGDYDINKNKPHVASAIFSTAKDYHDLDKNKGNK